MSRFRMNGPTFGESPRKPPRMWQRVLGWILMVISVPLMGLMPFAFLAFEIDGFGYLTGNGEKLTVTVTESSVGGGKAQPGSSRGEGHYTHDGERVTVNLWNVTEGETVEARLAITSTLGEPGGKAYVSSGAAISDIAFGAVFMVGCVSIGLGLFRAGRGIKSLHDRSPHGWTGVRPCGLPPR